MNHSNHHNQTGDIITDCINTDTNVSQNSNNTSLVIIATYMLMIVILTHLAAAASPTRTTRTSHSLPSSNTQKAYHVH